MAETKELRTIVRIANVDVNGEKPIYHELTKIRGIGTSFSRLICNLVGLSRNIKAGELTEKEIQRIENVISNPEEFGGPEWMLNRRKDPETAGNIHLITSDLKFTQDNDIKLMRKIKSYKGMRHSAGLPVRGQKTKSNFRKNKGKVASVKKKTV